MYGLSKIRSRGIKRFIVALLIMTMTMGFASITYAANDELETVIEELCNEATRLSKNTSDTDKFTNFTDAVKTKWDALADDTGIVTSPVAYDGLDATFGTSTKYFAGVSSNNYVAALKEMKSLKASHITANNNSNSGEASNIAKTKVNDMAAQFNVAADIDEASNMLKGFKPFIALVSGILAYTTILGLSLFTAFDVAYLASPIAKGKMDQAAQSGGMASTSSKATGGVKFRLVTDDALMAYDEATQAQKQPWLLYLKRRTYTFIACAVIVYILLSGNITFLINIVLKALSGVFDTLNRAAL